MNTDTVVVAQGLSRHYEVKSHLFSPPRITQALTEANFRLQAGKTLAVVGESGCGKSTLARLVTMIEERRPTITGSLVMFFLWGSPLKKM